MAWHAFIKTSKTTDRLRALNQSPRCSRTEQPVRPGQRATGEGSAAQRHEELGLSGMMARIAASLWVM
jgi:hypothetical protein